MEERVQKFLANQGVCSRRKAEEAILAGKVKVNGKVISELGTKIELENRENNKIIKNAEETNSRNYNKKRPSKNNFANFNISAILNSDINTPILEILGIKLYLDDFIIIGLLFFLYKEDVQDELLFFILILLLLS